MNAYVTKIAGQTVVIGNILSFRNKLTKFVSQGPEKLNMVTDFDYTMSQYIINGQRGFSCHRVLEECGHLGEDYHVQAKALQSKYYKIEISPTIPHEEKFKHMHDWVTFAHDLLLSTKLTKRVLISSVKNAVTNQLIALRANVIDFIAASNKAKVPLLIFSAGIADILEEVILINLKSDVLPDNVHIISNRCIFDASQETRLHSDELYGASSPLIGFENPVFHVLNKRASEVINVNSDHPYFTQKDLIGRENLILFGDSLGDCYMQEGLHHSPDSTLKIGFLNDKPERLPEFLAEGFFDMVILGDPSFQIPLLLLSSVNASALCDELTVLLN